MMILTGAWQPFIVSMIPFLFSSTQIANAPLRKTGSGRRPGNVGLICSEVLSPDFGMNIPSDTYAQMKAVSSWIKLLILYMNIYMKIFGVISEKVASEMESIKKGQNKFLSLFYPSVF